MRYKGGTKSREEGFFSENNSLILFLYYMIIKTCTCTTLQYNHLGYQGISLSVKWDYLYPCSKSLDSTPTANNTLHNEHHICVQQPTRNLRLFTPKQMETENTWFSHKNVHQCHTKHLAAIIAWYFGTLWHCSGWSKN